MNTTKIFFSKKTNNKVFEIEKFPTKYVYWSYPLTGVDKKLVLPSDSNELSFNEGEILINKLMTRKTLYI